MYFCTNLVGTLDAGLRDRVEVAGGGLDAGQFVEARRAAARQQFGNLSRRSGSGGASVAVGVDPARRRCAGRGGVTPRAMRSSSAISQYWRGRRRGRFGSIRRRSPEAITSRFYG